MNSRENLNSQKSEKGLSRFARATGQALRFCVKMSHLSLNEKVGIVVWAFAAASFLCAMIQRFN